MRRAIAIAVLTLAACGSDGSGGAAPPSVADDATLDSTATTTDTDLVAVGDEVVIGDSTVIPVNLVTAVGRTVTFRNGGPLTVTVRFTNGGDIDGVTELGPIDPAGEVEYTPPAEASTTYDVVSSDGIVASGRLEVGPATPDF